jgi:putative sigma-54 modulation protein
MEATITGKGIDITPAIRSYIDNKLKKVHRIVPDLIDMTITLSTEKHLINADFSVKTNTSLFTSHGSTTDTFASINEALDNLLKQARRSNKKVKNKKGRNRLELDDLSSDFEMDETDDDDIDTETSNADIEREKMPIKPLSIEEARLQIRSSSNGFILFRNATTSEINLLYKRKDGSLGLVETDQ